MPADPALAPIALHCLPYAGGGAMTYLGWQDRLPASVEVLPCRVPGRDDRFGEPPLDSFARVLEHLDETLLPALRPPYALFGHSMGALVAFGVARRARERGLPPPVRLFVSGMNAPQLAGPTSRAVDDRSDAELMEHMRRIGGAPEVLEQDPELLELYMPLIRADMKVVETFRCDPEEPLECPISVWGGRDDVLTHHEGLDAWRSQTRDDFRLRLLPGRHFFLSTCTDQLLSALAGDLRGAALFGR